MFAVERTFRVLGAGTGTGTGNFSARGAPGSWDPASARHFSDLGVYGGTGTWGFRGETGHGLCHCFDAQLSTL